MSKQVINPSHNNKGEKPLNEHESHSANPPKLAAEHEMLSLIVDEAIKGVDIARRYPAYYHKLIENPDLRQAFLDVLQSMADEDDQIPSRLPLSNSINLEFLMDQSPSPARDALQEGWQTSWNRTIRQLQDIFSPPQLAYRADPGQHNEYLFILLREEFSIGKSSYMASLECSLAENPEEGLTALLNFAIMQEPQAQQTLSIQATLQWGAYHETLAVTKEGKTLFPNIPLDLIYDNSLENINSGLSLTLQSH